MLLWNIHFKILVKTEFYDDQVPGREGFLVAKHEL
jgi:hypothetical protein